jgi:1-deoxy-D-xylulose-5-phosphate synthase
MMDLKNKSVQELKSIAKELREIILQTVSLNGGHLTSSLGAVDIITAMHYVFDVNKDPFIFDVGHQAYAHKILTDRKDIFHTLRQFDGVSGFTKPSESIFDYFIAGHSSTSISVGVGAAKAIELKGEDRVPVALIGDGSMSAGIVFEALNELGHHKYPFVIILNDNEMSIAKPIGAISRHLSKALSSRSYQIFKQRVERILKYTPDWADYMLRRFEKGFKLITPGVIFEELGIEYIGPADGHDLEELVEVLSIAKQLKKPVIVHVQTTKGKGYPPAEGHHEHWHGVGPFDLVTGEHKKSSAKNATAMFSEALMNEADKNEKILGITAAMPSGTGLDKLIKKYPMRFWDVAISEQHAVTSAAALAKEGFKPFVAIYSTFFQRAYDQIIHDVAIPALPVVFAIDRAGIVGEDGETHQGAFDISFLRAIPNIEMFAPRDEQTMHEAVKYAANAVVPTAFRYPRGAFSCIEKFPVLSFDNKSAQLLVEGTDMLLIGYGNGVGRALKVAALLREGGINPAVLDLRFVKPIDSATLVELTKKYLKWFVISDSAKAGGVASAIMEIFMDADCNIPKIVSFEYDDNFIKHGATAKVEEYLGILPEQIAMRIKESLDI